MAAYSRYLSAHRFGLGHHPGGAGGDAPGALAAELGAYDPVPKFVAQLPGRGALLADLAAYRAAQRAARADNGGGDDMMAAMAAPAVGQRAKLGEMPRLRRHYLTAGAARLAHALATPTPFAERLVYFWSNHFAVSANSQPVALLAGDHENRGIRPHIMGRFADLLRAAVLHPAMLMYLDQAAAVGPNSPLGQRAAQRRRGPDDRVIGLNENLAREILELHTLGVRSGYGQGDVGALAGALTGWTVAGLGGRGAQVAQRLGAAVGDTVFVAATHEPGAKIILGTRFADAGRAQALAVLDHLAAQPATARHIATKLARHFSADTPAPALVVRLERAFLESGGDLPTVYRALLTAPEAWQTAVPKFKSPWDWAVSAMRATGAVSLANPRQALASLDRMGMPVWRPGSPAGYDDVADRWAGPAALLQRAELAGRIAAAAAVDTSPADFAAAQLADAARPDTLAAIARADSAVQGVAMALLAPEFLRR